MKAPFVWFGGKSQAAPILWRAFGNPPNYVEPFAGSLGCLLSRPAPGKLETVNDIDAHIPNVWRAIAADPEAVAHYACWPVFEVDLHARHRYLIEIRGKLGDRLTSDPEYFDPKAAGWWVWGCCLWIGSNWCGDRSLLKRTRPRLDKPGRGVHQQTVRSKPDTTVPRGILVESDEGVYQWFWSLRSRLRRVRVLCGGWERALTPAVLGTGSKLENMGMLPCAVLLDPPYLRHDRHAQLYAAETDVAEAVRTWALENGNHSKLRIALCAYDGHFEMGPGWRKVRWASRGGYGRTTGGRRNRTRETIWLSPHCLSVERTQEEMFGVRIAMSRRGNVLHAEERAS